MTDPIGLRLRSARVRAGLTQDEVARRAAISVRTVRHVESGYVRNPRFETLSRFAEVVGCPPLVRDVPPAAGACPRPPAAATPLDVRLLGPLTVVREKEALALPLKQSALLSLLALKADQAVGVEEIGDVLWFGQPPSAYAQLVHTYVARLRRVVGGQDHPRTSRQISTVRGGYTLNRGEVDLDVDRFHDTAARATAEAVRDPRAALGLYEEALRCWQGRLLQDVPQLWHHPAAIKIAQRRIDLTMELADLALPLGRSALAVEQLLLTSYEEPLHEPLQARVVLALSATGRRAAALRQFTEVCGRLRRELGVAPSPELLRARDQVVGASQA